MLVIYRLLKLGLSALMSQLITSIAFQHENHHILIVLPDKTKVVL